MRRLLLFLVIAGIAAFWIGSHGLKVKVLGIEVKKEQAKQFYQKILNQTLASANKTVGQVMGKATSRITDSLFDSTVANAVKQFEKLPEKQKSEVKKAICK